MNGNRQFPSLIGPILLIGFGILLLLSNMGVIQWSVWEAALRLWPLLLVGAGLDLLVGRRSAWGSVLAGLVMVALLAGGIWWISQGAAELREPVGVNVSQPLESARSAAVDIKLAAAGLQVTGGAPADKLVTGVVTAPLGELAGTSRVENDVLKYSLSVRSDRVTIGGWPSGRSSSLSLNSQTPMALGVQLAAGEITLDLRGTKVGSVTSETGAGKTTVTLPPGGPLSAKVSVAVGEAVVRVPKGSAYRAKVSTAIGLSRLPNSGQSFGTVNYSSPDYAAASARIELDITCAVGMVTIEEY